MLLKRRPHRNDMGSGPDFIIIGAMKAGTTTLFRWLEEHPDCRMPKVKEPEFFIDEQQWNNGPSRYISLFDRPAGMISGEASVGYTTPSVANLAAERIAEVVPDAKLVFVARDPITRLRSHYRHEVQRGRETRPFSQAVGVNSPYVQRSLYSDSLAPFVDRFALDQIKVVVFEILYESASAEQSWGELLEFLGLAANPLPATVANVSANKQGFSRLASWAWERGISKPPSWLPRSTRTIMKRLLLRDDEEYRDLIQSSDERISPDLRHRLAEDAERFVEAFGIDPPWELLRAHD